MHVIRLIAAYGWLVVALVWVFVYFAVSPLVLHIPFLLVWIWIFTVALALVDEIVRNGEL